MEISKKQELKDYLFNLPFDHKRSAIHGYKRSAIPDAFERIRGDANLKYREIIWELILSGDPLSLCGINAKGLQIKNQAGGYHQIKDSKLFVSSIFVIAKEHYFEHMPLGYILKTSDKIFELRKLYDHFDEILERTKWQPGLPYEPKRLQFKKDLYSWTDIIIESLKKPTEIKETPMWKKDKKKNEKILIPTLYDCFKRACDGITQKDIFYNIAKVTLFFGLHTRSEQVSDINPSLISKESNRVEKIYSRFNRQFERYLSRIGVK